MGKHNNKREVSFKVDGEIIMGNVTDDDKRLAKDLYGLFTGEIFQAEKLYYRSGRSFLACCKVIANKRTRK